MRKIPVLAFAAYSGTGKTTLIEKVVQDLKIRGLRVAVIKHDSHSFEIDHEGKDSWRYSQAGADISIISSDEKTAIIEQRKLSLVQILALAHDVDLVLVEGYKFEPLTQIGLFRLASGKDFTSDLSRYVAVVTDIAVDNSGIPHFGYDDIRELTEFIIGHMNDFTCFNGRELTQCPCTR